MKKHSRLSAQRLRVFLSEEAPQLGPVVSVCAIVGTLFFLVFLQMEERRLGYGVLKLSRIYREKVDEKHYKEINLARSLRLEKMEALASRKLTLHRVGSEQVIHLNENDRLAETAKIPAKISAPPVKRATTGRLESEGAVH